IQADLMACVRARENGVPFVAANKCGVELQSVAYCGKSAIVDAGGAFVARAPQDDECVIAGEIEAGAPARVYATSLAIDKETESRLFRIGSELPPRLRVAFTAARESGDVARCARLALQSDADILIAAGRPGEPAGDLSFVSLDAVQPETAMLSRN